MYKIWSYFYFYLLFMFKKVKPLNIIVAHNNLRGIGYKNKIPWFIPEDLHYFKRLTINNTVIMGRKTYESLTFPLRERRNIVITSKADSKKYTDQKIHQNLFFCKNVKEALILAQKDSSFSQKGEIFVIGGAQIYNEILSNFSFMVKDVYATIIDKDCQCDTYYPYFVNFKTVYQSIPMSSKIGNMIFRHYKYTNIDY